MTNVGNQMNTNNLDKQQSLEKPNQVVRARKKTSAIKQPKSISESATKMARVDGRIVPNTIENKKNIRIAAQDDDETDDKIINCTPKKRLKFDGDENKENKTVDGLMDRKKIALPELKPNSVVLNLQTPRPSIKPKTKIISLEGLNKKLADDETMDKIEVSSQPSKTSESKLVSYARSFKCPQCSFNYSTTDRLPKIICWEKSMGMVCQPCSNSLMQANASCPFCDMHSVQPMRFGQEFVTNSVLLDMIRLVEEPAEKRRVRLNLIYEHIEKTLTNSLDQIGCFLDGELNSPDQEFIASINDKTNETVSESLRRVKGNIGKTFESLIKKIKEEKLPVTESAATTATADENVRKKHVQNQPRAQTSSKPTVGIESAISEITEIKLNSFGKNLLSIIPLSKRTFLCIEKNTSENEQTMFKVLDENGISRHEITWTEKNNLTSFANTSILNPNLYGLCFAPDYFTLSCFMTKKLIKFKHLEGFLPILDSHRVDMRMLTSSNEEICFHQVTNLSNTNYIRTFSYKGERGAKIGPLQYSDETKPYYISLRFQLISLTQQFLYIRDDFDSSMNSIRVFDRTNGACRFMTRINTATNDRILVDLTGRLVILNKQRRLISVYDHNDGFKVTREIVLDAKLVLFDSWSITVDNELALFFSQTSTVKFFQL